MKGLTAERRIMKPATPDFTPAPPLALVAAGKPDPWLYIPGKTTHWVPVYVSNCPPARRLDAVKYALAREGYWVEECAVPRVS